MSVETNLRELFGVDDKPESFDHVAITVANSDIIRGWSKGEVKNPETINYRTFKPEKGGLFCEKCMPSRIGLMLDMSARHLERVIYYEDYIVTEPGDTPLERGQLLTELELRDAEDDYGEDTFRAGMGAEALQDLLSQINLAELLEQLEEEMENTKSKQTMKKLDNEEAC